jgi:chemotaxis signal transduction protein
MHPIQSLKDVWYFLEERGLVVRQLTPDAATADTSVVGFRLGNGYYSVPRASVCTIQPLVSYVPLPLTQPYIVGLLSWQDHDVVILDIRPLMAQISAPPSPDAYLIILRLCDAEIALLVDSLMVKPPFTA